MADAPVIVAAPTSGVATGAALTHFTIWPGNAIGDKWQVFARVLQARTGANCSLICSMPQDNALFRRTWGDFPLHIQEVMSQYDTIRDPLPSASTIEKRAEEYERRYGILMVDLLQSDRHLGRAYAWGGLLYPRSRLGEAATYLSSLRLAMTLLDFFERYLDTHPTSLMLMEGVGSLHTICLAVVLRRRGIPLRCPSPSRIQNFAYWGENEWFESSLLDREYRRAPLDSDDRQEIIAGPYMASAVERQRQVRRFRLRTVATGIARDVVKRIYQPLIGYRPYAGNWLRDTAAYRIRAYTRERFLSSHSLQDPAEFRDFRYVVFPLNHEPEASLSVAAPEFNHQGAVVDLVAKSLPAGVRLVVKEHQTAGIAARPPGFFEWLAKIPNVVLASMHLNLVQLMQMSRGVVILTGSAGIEAAVMGLPVLSFGRHNTYNIVPHVTVIDSIGSLRPLLAEICADEYWDEEKASPRRREGARFLSALKASSVDLGGDLFFTDGGGVSPQSVSRLVDLLLCTL